MSSDQTEKKSRSPARKDLKKTIYEHDWVHNIHQLLKGQKNGTWWMIRAGTTK
jgi:hypothetical protein